MRDEILDTKANCRTATGFGEPKFHPLIVVGGKEENDFRVKMQPAACGPWKTKTLMIFAV